VEGLSRKYQVRLCTARQTRDIQVHFTAEEHSVIDPQSLSRSDPLRHTTKTRTRLTELAEHLRSDVDKIDDPRAQALFETTAEVLLGLEKAFADYESKAEPAWQ
jgi:hypothetical protein